MTEQMENLVLEQLRLIRGTLDGVAADISDLKLRMSSVEEHLGSLQVQLAGVNRRMDRSDERLTRVERRLGLLDA